MKHARYLMAVLAIWVAWAIAPGDGAFGWSGTTTTVATAPATDPTADVPKLRAEAVRELLGGQFESGLALLEQAQKLQPLDAAATARALTEKYLDRRRDTQAGRKAELAAEVARVRLARLAEKHRSDLVSQKIDEELFGSAEDIGEAFFTANKQLRGNGTSWPKQAREAARESLERAGKQLASAEALVGSGHGEWGKAFRRSAQELRRHLVAYREAWRTVRLPEDRPTLKAAGEKVQDALMDLGVLVSRDPLAAALTHARQAKQLAADEEEFLRQDWVRQLIGEAEQRGAELIGQGKWGEALTIYGHAGLSDLDTDNATYQDAVKRIYQHVRVINLYAGKDSGAEHAADWPPPPPASQPAVAHSPTELAELPRWREMITGIDTRMVRNAISQIDYNYVKPPNYRKIGVAALEALKVLVETPGAADAFPALRDNARRSAFLAGLNTQIQQLSKLASVDHLHVALALNRILDLNADTLALPPEVINMEFAEGLTGELDRFTTMIWPHEMDDFNKRTMGSFFGIGIQIRKDPGKPIEVVTPLPNTPAFRARIQAGDLILRVDGKSTETMKLEKAVRLITGPRHTGVALTIKRHGLPKPFEVSIVRDKIEIQTVMGWRRLPDGKWNHFLDGQARIAYVRISQFTGTTVEELRAVLRELREAKAEGLILDLRFNPGGLLNGAVDVADEFLPRGLIVRTKGRNVRESERSATALGQYQKGKLVVLVNQVSASAAEIVSGALRDWGRAIVVGERTYGKASVQRLIPLRTRRARLKLTTAYYYLPCGTSLHRDNDSKEWGVKPHMTVPVTIRQMNRWAEIRQETDLLKSVDDDTLSTLLAQQLGEDFQLQTALLLVRLQLLLEAT